MDSSAVNPSTLGCDSPGLVCWLSPRVCLVLGGDWESDDDRILLEKHDRGAVLWVGLVDEPAVKLHPVLGNNLGRIDEWPRSHVMDELLKRAPQQCASCDGTRFGSVNSCVGGCCPYFRVEGGTRGGVEWWSTCRLGRSDRVGWRVHLQGRAATCVSRVFLPCDVGNPTPVSPRKNQSRFHLFLDTYLNASWGMENVGKGFTSTSS